MTKTRPDAVVTDLDGTLLGPDRKVGPRDAAAIRRLMELGVPVVLGTGRPPLGVRGLVEELGTRLALCANGGCCYDFAQGRMTFSALMDHGIARRLIDWLFAGGRHFLIHCPRRIYRTPDTGHISRYGLREEEDGLLTPGMPLDGVEILKILATQCDGPALCAEAQAVFSPGELAICSSDATLVDFNPPGVDKGWGLRAMAREEGWEMANILALGDNYNDLTMLGEVGLSAAPATAVPDVLAVARFVAAPCGENPLAAAVDHYFPGLLEGI